MVTSIEFSFLCCARHQFIMPNGLVYSTNEASLDTSSSKTRREFLFPIFVRLLSFGYVIRVPETCAPPHCLGTYAVQRTCSKTNSSRQ